MATSIEVKQETTIETTWKDTNTHVKIFYSPRVLSKNMYLVSYNIPKNHQYDSILFSKEQLKSLRSLIDMVLESE